MATETTPGWYTKPVTGIPIDDLAYPNSQGDEGKAPVTVSTPGGIDIAWTSIPSITLNGATNTNPAFYAPTTSGSSGQLLYAGGANTAPTWTNTIPVTALAMPG